MVRRILYITFNLLLVLPVQSQVVPSKDGDIYSLRFANLNFEVDANDGAKVTSFKLNSSEFLVINKELPHYGSTLWTSPQSEKEGLEVSDRGKYFAEIVGDKMVFSSEQFTDKKGNKLKFVKTYSGNQTDSSIVIRYSLINQSGLSINKALWELTRVPAEGLFFWPSGDNEPWGKNNTDISDSVKYSSKHYWIDFNSDYPGSKKFFCDGSKGWQAYVNESNVLFVKTFDDVPSSNVAPGEDEIEYWINPDHYFLELENQGVYAEILNNDTLHYDVKWYLRQLPNGVNISIGSEELINTVNRVVQAHNSTPVNNIFAPVAEKPVVYPNLANDYVYVNLNNLKVSEAQFLIVNIEGQTVLKSKIEGDKYVNVEFLTPGVYIYVVHYDNKFVKNKLIVI